MILIRTACIPACLRMVTASWRTMLASTIEMAKLAEANPVLSPTESARALTVAECELGMPPVEVTKPHFHS